MLQRIFAEAGSLKTSMSARQESDRTAAFTVHVLEGITPGQIDVVATNEALRDAQIALLTGDGTAALKNCMEALSRLAAHVMLR